MNDLNVLLKTINRSALFFLSGCLLVWALIPGWKVYTAGLILGTVISLINARLLAMKIHKITEVALANTGKKVGSGFAARMSMVLIGAMTCVRFPHFHLAFAVIGFFYVQLVTIILGFLYRRKIP